ncbi:MAG: hypothetical protein HY425_02720 [Candidatus Levybacteria bacterium]|nr:hypothetical protein [Candidatus Levybacteria bacterium]
MAGQEQRSLAERLGTFNFSEEARQALEFAIGKGRNFGYIETTHILLGLLNNPGNKACKLLLTKRDLNLQTIKANVDFLLEHEKRDLSKDTPINFTPRAKNAVLFALTEAAKEDNQGTIDTHHLLFGLLSDRNAIATVLLEPYGITQENLTELRKMTKP